MTFIDPLARSRTDEECEHGLKPSECRRMMYEKETATVVNDMKEKRDCHSARVTHGRDNCTNQIRDSGNFIHYEAALEELKRRLPFGVCRPQLDNIGRLSL